LITNADPHRIGTVGVVGSGGVSSTVVVLEDALEKGEKGDEGEHDLLYADVLKSDKQRVKGGQPAKFGYLPMMAVATLGALNAESFCVRVL
jgi:hypothetical protein